MPRWQVFCAVSLRRLPELRSRLDAIETRVQEIYSAYEVARSKFSQHELQHLEDKKSADSTDIEVFVRETAQDKEDRWNKEKSELVFGNYNDRLARTQYLFLKQKFGSDIKEQWLLPQALFDVKQDKDLLDTARRALREKLDIVNGYRIVSKVPTSVYSFRYPKKVLKLTGHDGAKVFFLKAHLDTPSESVLKAVDATTNSDRLKWLTRDEVSKFVHKKYITSFSQGLLHENRVDTDRVLQKASEYAIAMKKEMIQKQ